MTRTNTPLLSNRLRLTTNRICVLKGISWMLDHKPTLGPSLHPTAFDPIKQHAVVDNHRSDFINIGISPPFPVKQTPRGTAAARVQSLSSHTNVNCVWAGQGGKSWRTCQSDLHCYCSIIECFRVGPSRSVGSSEQISLQIPSVKCTLS